ncbi:MULTISPECIES: O-antigen ligase family protein [Niastella]|uniref:O-antigen ligase family protein n=1 Tax=Niastella soli TaxID=2821487 RepID=A0ABS3YMC2_9BACT|nr:O-antigen ligase family protein [Niastella soli]MBO9199022.1 O-antigen ligase family protein [Niastella soli]
MRSLFLLDDQAGLLTIKDKLLYVLVVIFLVTFYPSHMPSVNVVALVLLSLYSFFIYGSFREKLSLLRQRKEVWAMAAFYLLHIVSSLCSKDVAEGFSWTVIRMPLFVFPVAFGFVYIRQVLKERILFAYAVITTITILFCFIWAIVAGIATNDITMLYNDNLTYSIDKQSIYVALLVNVAIFSFGYLLYIKSALVAKKGLVFTSLCMLVVSIFFMASRISIITLFGSIVCVAVWWIVQKRKLKLLGLVGAGIVAAMALLVIVFPKTWSRFRELTNTKYVYSSKGEERHMNMNITPDQWNGANLRLAVWSCGWELVKQHPVFGVQVGDKVEQMVGVYKAKHFEIAYKSRRNIHNNYLDVLVSFGFFGLLLFLWGFLFEPLRQCIRTRDYFGVFVIAAFMLAFIPETYFDRSMGNMMFAFFVALIVSYRKPVANVV